LSNDAQTWNNKADALMQLAEAHSRTGMPDSIARASESVSQGRDAYLQASMLSSSEDGDDLPGQLCNWGTGLLAAANIALASADIDGANALLQDAIMRLKLGLELSQHDIQVCAQKAT
jgi:hypothetical protein